MHRQIMGNPIGMVDHIHGNTLDNRRSELRLATHTENMRNRKVNRNNRGGLKGAHWHKKVRRWQAQIRVEKENIYLGIFDTPEEAHAAYCEAADRYFGEFARTT